MACRAVCDGTGLKEQLGHSGEVLEQLQYSEATVLNAVDCVTAPSQGSALVWSVCLLVEVSAMYTIDRRLT